MSGNALKILAALFMICDHIGMLYIPVFLPKEMFFLRYIGRMSYPIFAFFIAEGCRYTKNKSKYLGLLTFLGIAFYIVYYFATGDKMLNVIVSFSLAVGFIYLWQWLVGAVKDKKVLFAVLFFLLWAAYSVACFALCRAVHVDYNFGGIILPWLVYLFKNKWLRLGLFAVGIVYVASAMGEYAQVQLWGLISVPIMALYNGERGKWRMKYFFYVFYPAHLVLLYGIFEVISGGIR